MDTKFCKECDADYDWACPECPGCVARNSWNHLNDKYQLLIERYRLAKAVIDALQKCNNCYAKLATRYETFEEYDSYNERTYTEHVWRCDDCSPQISELDYAPQLRKYLESTK